MGRIILKDISDGFSWFVVIRLDAVSLPSLLFRMHYISHLSGSEALAQLPREAVGAPSLEVLKARLDGALDILSCWGQPAHGREWELNYH